MWVLGLLVIIAAWEGLKEGAKALRDDYRKSRNAKVAKGPKGKRKVTSSASHAFGYWMAEGTRVFPQFRHGAARGYHDARTKQHKAHRDRERSAADHAEAQRDASREIYHERTRRNRARRDMRDMAIPAVDDDTPPLRVLDAPDGEDAPVTDWAPMRVVQPQRPDFVPVTPPGGAGQNADDNGQPAPKEGSPPVATKTESTYSRDIVLANALITEAENRLAQMQKRDWRRHMEDISMAGLDSTTLSHAADLNDSFEEEIKAAQKTVDSATAFRDSLQRTHGAGHEYHSTTEGGGAERDYLTD